MKTILCKEMGSEEMKNCPWKGEGETVEELVDKTKEHVKETHGKYWKDTMSKMTDDEIKSTVIEPNMKEE